MEWVPPKSAIDRIDAQIPLPGDLDALSDGIFMPHQRAWIADRSDLKVAEKGRRTGFTWAEAFDGVLTASSAPSAGGDHIWYIGDTKDKGREFVNTCAGFARKLSSELLEIEEFLFDDVQQDGSTRQITAWRISFASGYRISALSSNPANIRGLQGVVIIDEAAFHANVQAVLDACLALLIWGGKVRIISTHNGNTNAFNELIREIREGKRVATVHRATFDDAVAGGLYERVCLVRRWTPSVKGKAEWYAKVRKVYGTRTEAMHEELDAIPREGDGTMLALSTIEDRQKAEYLVARWTPPPPIAGKDFVDWSEPARRLMMEGWLATHVLPVLEKFPLGVACAIGGDFAMRQDRSSYPVGYVDQRTQRHVPLIVEMRQCPYDQQKQALFYIGTWLRTHRRLTHVVLDANGNGMVLAQEARQKFGEGSVMELIASDGWLREHTPKFTAAFTDKTIWIPADLDTRDDLHQFRIVRGVGKIPSAVRTEGTDGGRRHADNAVGLLNFFAATLMASSPIDFQSSGEPRAGLSAWGDSPLDARQTSSGWGTIATDRDMRGW